MFLTRFKRHQSKRDRICVGYDPEDGGMFKAYWRNINSAHLYPINETLLIHIYGGLVMGLV